MDSQVASRMISVLSEAVVKISGMENGKQVIKSSTFHSACGRQILSNHEGLYIELCPSGNTTLAVRVGVPDRIFMITWNTSSDGKIGGKSRIGSQITEVAIKELRDDEAATAVAGCLKFLLE